MSYLMEKVEIVMNNFGFFNKQIAPKGFNEKLLMFVGTLFLVVLLLFLGWFIYLYSAKNRFYSEYKKSLEYLNGLEVSRKKHQEALLASETLKNKRKVQLYHQQCGFYPMLYALVKLIPDDIRFTKIDFFEKQLLVLRGESGSAKSLTNFVNTLKLKPCFEQCALEGMSKKKNKERTYFEFTIKVNITNSHGQNQKVGA